MTVSVLENCKIPTKLTHIMHGANLNCNVLSEILDELASRELVASEVLFQRKRRTVFYFLTDKGSRVLAHWFAVRASLCGCRVCDLVSGVD